MKWKEYITKTKVATLHFSKIIGVTSIWEDDTVYLSFYLNEQLTETEFEEISDVCTEIIAQMPRGMLEDRYLILENSDSLPQKFLAYKKSENQFVKD